MLAFLSGSWVTILKWLAIAGAVLGVLLYVRNSGRNVEKVEQMERTIKNVSKAEKIRRDIAANPDDVPERLRKFYID